jgi:hypothetical protein
MGGKRHKEITLYNQDNVTLELDGVLYFRIVDPFKVFPL